MFKNDYLALIAAFFIGASIIISGNLIGEAIKYAETEEPTIPLTDSEVLNLSQTARYLNITEEEVNGIIQTEKTILEKSGSFDGKMFPYFTINHKQYFYKNEIDEWLREISSRRAEYNTVNGWILN